MQPKEKTTTSEITEISKALPRPNQYFEDVDPFEDDYFDEDDGQFEDLYAYEINDWWEPYSQQYPVVPKARKIQKYSPSPKDSGNSKTGLSIKLMDILSDEVVAKLNGLSVV